MELVVVEKSVLTQAIQLVRHAPNGCGLSAEENDQFCQRLGSVLQLPEDFDLQAALKAHAEREAQ